MNKIIITLTLVLVTINCISQQQITGAYTVELIVPSDSTKDKLFPDVFLYVEKTTEPNSTLLGMPFIIHYADNFFHTSADINPFLVGVKNAIIASWKKEVIDWSLGVPIDADNIYHIIINNSGAIMGGANDDCWRGESIEEERCIYIDADISPARLNTIDQNEFLYMLISHEFLHGIQWSYMPLGRLTSTFPGGASVEANKRFWLIEGQAKFLETVFMSPMPTGGNYSSNSINSAFINSTYNGDYSEKTDVFINDIYDDGIMHSSAYNYPSLHKASYKYAIF